MRTVLTENDRRLHKKTIAGAKYGRIIEPDMHETFNYNGQDMRIMAIVLEYSWGRDNWK